MHKEAIRMQIGEKLKQKRNEAGYSQEVLAEKVGVSRQTISNWETNRSYPDIGSVLRLSDLYGISLDELLKEDTNMRKHVEETAKLPMRWWNFLCGLTIALLPLNTLLHYWGAATGAMVLKILALIFIPVLIFTRWKFTGGEKKELFITLGFYGFLVIGELLYQGHSIFEGSSLLYVVMAFVLIYGYGHYLGKGLAYWLLIFLYFGTLIYIAVDPNLSIFQSYEQASQSQLYGTYVVEESLQGPDSSGLQVTIFSDDTITINGEYVGHMQYTKPLENQPHLYAVWQLVPEHDPDTLYRLEVDTEMNKTLSCQSHGQLQWHWQLIKLPNILYVYTEGDFTGNIPMAWYSRAQLLSGETGNINYRQALSDFCFRIQDDSVTELTVTEIFHSGDGDKTTVHTIPRKRDEFTVDIMALPWTGAEEEYAEYRIPWGDGEFIVKIRCIPE